MLLKSNSAIVPQNSPKKRKMTDQLLGYSVLNQNGEKNYDFRNLAKRVGEHQDLVIYEKNYDTGVYRRQKLFIKDVVENVDQSFAIIAVKHFGRKVREMVINCQPDSKFVNVMTNQVIIKY